MDLKSAEADATTLAQNAGKSTLRFLWTWTALHPRTSVLISAGLILASGIVGFMIRGAL